MIPAGGNPSDMVPGPNPPKQQSEADPQTLTGLYEYIQTENKALKLQLASLQCLVNDILTETKKPTSTARQPEIQVPETVLAPPSQQLKEKQKHTT
jgi:hypothetical protein